MRSGRIVVIGAGGTLAMTRQGDGLAPARTAADLVESVRPFLAGTELAPVDAFSRPSANLGFADVAHLAGLVEEAAEAGADGVVITQGTDTIEETAFALELISTARIPVVMTGGMRGAAEAGADGPANLLGAIIAASSAPAGMGVMVVMNDEVHASRYVSKVHTTARDAFSSGDAGLVGRIEEGDLRLAQTALPALTITRAPAAAPWPRVALVRLAMDDDGGLIDAVASSGFDGCILEAMGAGHAPASLVARLEALAARAPVVLVSRTGRGRVCRKTYAYAGSEIDLLARNLVWGGALTGLKARVLLTLCLRAAARDAAADFLRIAQLI